MESILRLVATVFGRLSDGFETMADNLEQQRAEPHLTVVPPDNTVETAVAPADQEHEVARHEAQSVSEAIAEGEKAL